MRKSLLAWGLAGIIGAGSAGARGALYDDFSSGSIDSNRWEIRQDTEGQPFTDEYDVRLENGNYVFHTQQNNIGDRRTYLVPKHEFVAGDTLDYDVNVISKEGNYGNVNLLFGGGFNRAAFGLIGYDGVDELGTSHVKFSFYSDNLHIDRISPTGQTLEDNFALSDPNAKYTLYVGTFTGHNGMTHMDYDNFYVNGIPEPSMLGIIGLGAGLLKRKRF